MSELYDAVYEPDAAAVLLDRQLPVDVDPMRALEHSLEVCRALGSVVRPLAVLLLIGLREPGLPFLEPEQEPPVAAWAAVRGGLSARVDTIPEDREDLGFRRVTLDDLAAPRLLVWGEQALAQPVPAGLESVPALLRSDHAAARLAAGRAAYRLGDGGDVLDVPVEQADGGSWALGPFDGQLLRPPVSWLVAWIDGTLHAEVRAHWSPWASIAEPEGRALAAAIGTLRERSWQLVAPAWTLGLEP